MNQVSSTLVKAPVKTSIAEQFLQDGLYRYSSVIPENLVDKLRIEIETASYGDQHPWFGEKRNDKRLRLEDIQEGPLLEAIRIASSLLENAGFKDLPIVDIQYSFIGKGRSSSPDWHIDGTWLAREAKSLGVMPFFQILVGIYLTDLSEPERGNLTYSPDGHHAIARFFKLMSPDQKEADVGIIFDNLKSLQVNPLEPILAKPGDVVLLHSLMPHSIANNYFADRPVLYLRYGDVSLKGLSSLSETDLRLWNI